MTTNNRIRNLINWFKNQPMQQVIFIGVLVAALFIIAVISLIKGKDMQAQGNAGQGDGVVSEMDSESFSDDAEENEIGSSEELLESELPENELTKEPTPNTEQTELPEESENTEIPSDSEEEDSIISVSMTVTSIEKDLKVKFVNQKNKLVTGRNFELTITKDGETNGVVHKDENQNGIIYIAPLEGGSYQIVAKKIDGVSMQKTTLTAKVKEEIVYEKVEVENEIKEESEIDVSVEDTADKEIEVETEIPVTETIIVGRIPDTSINLNK